MAHLKKFSVRPALERLKKAQSLSSNLACHSDNLSLFFARPAFPNMKSANAPRDASVIARNGSHSLVIGFRSFILGCCAYFVNYKTKNSFHIRVVFSDVLISSLNMVVEYCDR